MTTELVPKVITPSEVFIPNGLDQIIVGVEKIISEETAKPFDIGNEKDREQRKSFSYQISRSKTFVDDHGKKYVGEIKKKTKEIDAERKRFRDLMDKFRDDTRYPVTEWEKAEKIRVEEERQHEIYLMEWDEALAEDGIFTRERDIAAKEAEFAKIEADNLAKEESERIEKERIETEARIKKEAAEQAERDAADKIQAEKDAKEQTERDLARAEEDAKHAAELAEHNRVEAEFQAKEDQEKAVVQAKEDAEKKALAEKRKAEFEEERLKAIADKKASNKRHQASVNNKILAELKAFGIDEIQAKGLVIHIAKGGITKLRIEY